MADLVQLLQELGFGEYEAKAYVSLLQHHPATGYALAKTSGIPRANIYSVLQKLEERGATIAIETEEGTTFIPIPPGELTRRLSNRYKYVLETAQQLLEQITPATDTHFVQNIQGYPQLLEHARDLIHHTSQELIIALWQPEAQALAPSIAQAESRGVAITTLCLQACNEECGGCRDNIYRYHMTSNQAAHWLIVIGDNSEMVIGAAERQAVAMRTHNPNLIELSSWYIRHSITLAAILSDMGQGLEQMLNPRTRTLLASVGAGSSWLQQLLQLLANSRS